MMQKRVLLYVLLLLSLSSWAGSSARSDRRRLVRMAQSAQTYQQKAVALDSMQTRHTDFRQYHWMCEHLNSSDYTEWMNTYARLNSSLGNYAEAEQILLELRDSLASPRSAESRGALLNLTSVWLREGKYNEVIEQVGSHPDQLPEGQAEQEQARFYLAEAYYDRNMAGDDLRAIRTLDTLRAHHAQAQDSVYYRALNNLGLVYTGLDDSWADSAYQVLRQTCDYYARRQPATDAYYKVLSNLAYAEARVGHFDSALVHINQAIRWQRRQDGPTGRTAVSSLAKRAQIRLMQWRAGQLAEADTVVAAFKTFFEAERTYILHNYVFLPEHERLAFWSSQYEPLSQCYQVLDLDPAFAYRVALFVKSMQSQTSFSLWAAAQQDPTLRALLAQYEAGVDDEATLRSMQQQLDSHLRQNRRYQAFCQSMQTDITQVSQQLGPRDVAIEWVVSPRHQQATYTALLLHHDGHLDTVSCFTRSELLSQPVREGRTLEQALTRLWPKDIDSLYSNRALGAYVWDRVLAHVPSGGRIFFAPVELLNLLAVEYLAVERPERDFYRLSSTSQLCRQAVHEGQDRFLLVGGVNYNQPDTTATAGRADHTGYSVLRGAGYRFGSNSLFHPLQGSLQEVDSISRSSRGPMRVSLLRGSQATEAALKDSMPVADWVHIATHGYSVEAGRHRMMQPDSLVMDQLLTHSGLALAGANIGSLAAGQEDGLLTAQEISHLDLSRVQLVVLSACQTALGQVRDEETASLARGLKNAGVRAVIVSLWSVNDATSAYLMEHFYQNLQQGQSIHMAFQHAREQLAQWHQGGSAIREELVFNPATSVYEVQQVEEEQEVTDKPQYTDAFILIDALQ